MQMQQRLDEAAPCKAGELQIKIGVFFYSTNTNKKILKISICFSLCSFETE